jgi:ribonuclease BN (tRNA processing enzyme)
MLRLLSAGILTLTCAFSSVSSVRSQVNDRPSTSAIVLGVGSPNVYAGRSGTSIGIVAGGTLYVFDAGPGVERRTMEAQPKLKSLNVRTFGPVFISHLHMDHTLGLAALLYYHNINEWGYLELGGGRDLAIYGPGPANGAEGIGGLLDHLRSAYWSGVTAPGIRAEELTGRGGPQAHAIDIMPGVVYRDSSITVTAFPVAHKTPIAFGFRVQTADRVIVISGDTSPMDTVVDACNGCDLLFHELFGLDYGPGGPTGDAQGHTSAAQLGNLAQRARAKRLVIYHDVRAPHEEALALIRKEFRGDVSFARDLDIF